MRQAHSVLRPLLFSMLIRNRTQNTVYSRLVLIHLHSVLLVHFETGLLLWLNPDIEVFIIAL